ncbi:hypothetical protein DE146DRAFT_431275 [Phaeosphaeria sp. MPI-PUGE-AT-0046c]|nr:hypothetical protein DE146DRAFT_431275 [Phaeosphaeria sp. MPI-PUGE-AT-0046c]
MGICPSNPVCPSHNNCTITANDTTFTFGCGIEYFGGGIRVVETSSIKDCVESCSSTADCVAISFVSKTSTCILRDASSIVLESLNPSSESFRIYTEVSVSPSSSATASSSASPSPSHGLVPKDIAHHADPAPCPPQYAMLHPNGALYKRSTHLSTWTSHLLGPAHSMPNYYPHTPSSLLPFPKFPNSTWSYTATGTSANKTWGAELSHNVEVEAWRSYSVTLWSRQGERGNCKCNIIWCGETLLEFEPETEEYSLRSVLFGTGAKTEGDVGIEVRCKRGGERAGIVLGDASMELGWAG